MLVEANMVRRIAKGMRGSWRLPALAVVLLGLFAAATTAHAASNDDRVFIVGNYPVDATAENAVAAKARAISEGQQRAFRSLMKRLIPVTDYKQLDALKKIDARKYVTSVGVRSEERSSTRYIASLDFGFSPDAVRTLLRDRSVPYLERQAPETTVVLVYEAPNSATPGASVPRGMGQAEGSRLWTSVWRDLDLKNALAPIKVAKRLPQIQGDAVTRLATGDMIALQIFAQEYATSRVVIALAAPDPANKRIRVVLSGQDATGAFHLDRTYRIFDGDMAYTLELAAVVAQGILEGRWKAINVHSIAGGPAGAGGLEPVQIWVTYQGFPQWQSMRQILEETPGVADLTVGGQSARGASVALRYPGGGAGLAEALAPRGLTLEQQNGAWVLR